MPGFYFMPCVGFLLLGSLTTSAADLIPENSHEAHGLTVSPSLYQRDTGYMQSLQLQMRNSTVQSAASLRKIIGCDTLPRKPIGSKKGVSYARGETQYANMFRSVSWAYNWFSRPQWWTMDAPALRGGIDFVPMLHDGRREQTDFWKNNVDGTLRSMDRAIIAFNEPDMGFEAALSPQRAAELYQQYMQPYACRARLGAPAVTNSMQPGQGRNWLRSFLAACTHCIIDFIPVHVYSSLDDIGPYITQIAGAYIDSGRTDATVWVTEFGPEGNRGTLEQKKRLMRKLVEWMNGVPFVERFAYWSAERGNLIREDGRGLSELGLFYDSL